MSKSIENLYFSWFNWSDFNVFCGL